MTQVDDIAAIRVALKKLMLATDQAKLINNLAAQDDGQQVMHRLEALTKMLSEAYPTAAEALSALDRISD